MCSKVILLYNLLNESVGSVDRIVYLCDVKSHRPGETWTEFLCLEVYTRQRFNMKHSGLQSHVHIEHSYKRKSLLKGEELWDRKFTPIHFSQSIVGKEFPG